MHNTCRYCGASTVMMKDRKSGRWHPYAVGTTTRHRCEHWPTHPAFHTDSFQQPH